MILANVDDFMESALEFSNLPYTRQPYSARAWGDPLHSLCSYQGKLKPSIAHFLIREFTVPGDVVLDPFSGSGTIPLEARLQGRRAISNDLQELAYILSTAKTANCSYAEVESSKKRFLTFIDADKPSAAEIDSAVQFGLNGKIAEYFDPKNLVEILSARKYINGQINKLSPSDALVFASFLHILHGNRPYALSRTSHPVTPLKPKGEFGYRDLGSRLTAKLERALGGTQLAFDLEEPTVKLAGVSFWGDYESLPLRGEIDAVITSPPFAGSTRFHSSNWLRLWAAGWEPEDFKTKKNSFLEEKQKNNLGVYSSFFEKAATWLKPGGKLILHLGKTAKIDMRQELGLLSKAHFETVFGFDESVDGAENFGIKDQGATKYHQFLFLRKSS